VNGLLSGLRVVDFSLNIPGPFCTKLFADLGADVVKIEPPPGPKGDLLRVISPSQYWFLNRHKRVVELDLKSSEGHEQAMELLRDVDVVVEGFRPGVATRLGIGFDDVVRVSPSVVYCSISGYGQHPSELSQLPGHDMGYQARGGSMHYYTVVGERPPEPALPIADMGSGLFGAFTALAAVRGGHQGPLHVDVAMQDVSVFLSFPRWGDFYLTDQDGDVSQFAHLTPGYGLFETADREYVALAAVEDKFWAALCGALDRPDLAEPPYDTSHGRLAHREHLREIVAAQIGKYALDELLVLFAPHDVPVAKVRSASEVCSDPLLIESGLVRREPGHVIVEFPVRLNGMRPGGAD